MGVIAVEKIMAGESSVMIGLVNGKIKLTPLNSAIKGASKINKELIRVSKIMNI